MPIRVVLLVLRLSIQPIQLQIMYLLAIFTIYNAQDTILSVHATVEGPHRKRCFQKVQYAIKELKHSINDDEAAQTTLEDFAKEFQETTGSADI